MSVQAGAAARSTAFGNGRDREFAAVSATKEEPNSRHLQQGLLELNQNMGRRQP